MTHHLLMSNKQLNNLELYHHRSYAKDVIAVSHAKAYTMGFSAINVSFHRVPLRTKLIIMAAHASLTFRVRSKAFLRPFFGRKGRVATGSRVIPFHAFQGGHAVNRHVAPLKDYGQRINGDDTAVRMACF